ncbi:MAG: tetratricopeptide repeat protein [Methylococcales bacterium]|nr:tetratricopeptide repeat protein [Methylococcales bacterium]
MKKPLPKSLAKKTAVAELSQVETNRLIELFNQNKNDELERSARALLVKFPKHGFTWKVLGAVLQRLGRLEESLDAKKKSAELLPNDAEAAYNLGNALNEFGKFAEAEVSYKQALKINPNFKKANYNLGLVLQYQNRTTEAEESYQREIAINPDFAEAHSNLGNMLKNLGHLDKAEASYRRALVANPGYVDAYTNLLYTLAHNPDAPPEFAFQEALRFGEVAAQGIKPLVHSHENRDPNKKLRVAMVSGDFWNHAVAYFIEPLLACFDKNKFGLVAYYNHTQNDDFTQRIKSHFAGWRDVAALTDIQLAQQMANDGIDIVIDLSGHTDKNRLLSFVYKPAPIQISWLGYPATTGLQAMDYYLVDSDWSPQGLLDDFFIEKLVYLPTALTFAAPENSPPVVDAPVLKKGHITFGSFNRTSKLTQQTLDLWGNVLNEIPTAKMILGNVSDEPLQRQLENEFVKRGVAVERLTFHAKKSIPDYLALHGEVDFILDTFPYSGGTTTGFALWMGVPVLTYAWKSLAGRGGVVMLSRVDLHNDFTAHTPEQFVEMAKSWSENIEGLQTLRHQLRDRMKNSSKSKPENVAAGLEKSLRLMWERFCAGQSVESFTV